MELSEKRNKKIEYALYLACLLSNLSQMPLFVTAGMTQVIAFPGWIILAAVLLLNAATGTIVIRQKLLNRLFLAIVIIVIVVVESVGTGNRHLASSMTYNFLIALFIFLLGAAVAGYVSERVLRNLILIYIVSSLAVSFSIFIQYFGFGYRITSRNYAYASKNSISQIISTAVVFMIVSWKPMSTKARIAQIASLAFSLWILLLLRSRATLVSLAACIVVLAFSRSSNWKVKAAVFFACAAAVLVIMLNSSARETIVKLVILAGRDATNLDDVTSGRLRILSRFPGMIQGNWLTGIGATYYECFPLSAILQYGVVGGLLMIVFSLLPLGESFRHRKESEAWFLLLLVALGFSVNGLFEGLTPYGPGVKCYILWLLYGVMITRDSGSLPETPGVGNLKLTQGDL